MPRSLGQLSPGPRLKLVAWLNRVCSRPKSAIRCGLLVGHTDWRQPTCGPHGIASLAKSTAVLAWLGLRFLPPHFCPSSHPPHWLWLSFRVPAVASPLSYTHFYRRHQKLMGSGLNRWTKESGRPRTLYSRECAEQTRLKARLKSTMLSAPFSTLSKTEP